MAATMPTDNTIAPTTEAMIVIARLRCFDAWLVQSSVGRIGWLDDAGFGTGWALVGLAVEFCCVFGFLLALGFCFAFELCFALGL